MPDRRDPATHGAPPPADANPVGVATGAPTEAATGARPFRFFDNREKYLMFVTTCSEKAAVAARLGRELAALRPSPSQQALRLFDAGVGDGTVLSHLLRDLHRRFTHVPWVVVTKEISMEDVRLTLEKLPDRFHEHPEMIFVVSNLYYSEAPWLAPKKPEVAAALNWDVVPLEGSTSHEFGEQIRALHPLLAENWQVRSSEKTGNPIYVKPSVLILYRRDREFILAPNIPQRGGFGADYDLISASQPYRARMPADFKVRTVIAPMARALKPGGRLIAVQSYGLDPGMEIVRAIWPDEDPFRTGRQELVRVAREHLEAEGRDDFRYEALSDEAALFRYHLHTMPTEVGDSIGTSTLFAAWNAATYVAQIEDDRLEDALAQNRYLEAARAVLQRYGGLWFNDESFVVERKG